MPNLVGIGLSQVPTNSMLGGLAYQDPEHASIKDLDLKNLSQINSEISDTAYDIFVYDTRKDSDGGAWRKRTQHTSWYNETLGTEYRGTRREFPAVAVIVSDVSSDKVTIYDGDDPDLPMWMVFSAGNPRGIISWATSNITRIKLAAMNGIMVAATNDGGTIFKFVEDYVEIAYSSSNYQIKSGRTIADRNNAASHDPVSGTAYRVYVIGWYSIHDVSMTVLPNAPIDDRTGLPVPTIAVAQARGISIIMDDGKVINSTSNSSYPIYEISILPSGELYHRQGSGSNEGVCFNYPYTRIKNINLGTYANSSTFWYGTDDVGNSSSYLGFNTVAPNAIITPDYKSLNIGDNRGLTFVDVNKESLNHGMSAFTASNYSTGWMHGDVKGAFLSDTVTEKDGVNYALSGVAGGTNRLTSLNYDSGDLSWQMVDNASSANGYVNINLTGLTVGQTYKISMTWDNNAALDSGYQHRVAHLNGTANENNTNFTHWNKTNGSSETLTGVFTAQSVNDDDLVMYANAITLNISNFKIEETDDVLGVEKIANYNFAADFSTQWEVKNNANTSYDATNDRVTVTSTQNYSGIRLKSASLPTLTQGKRYIMTVDIHSISNPIRFGVVSGGTKDNVNSTGAHTLTFTAQASVTEVFVEKPTGSNSTFVLNSVSIREADDDRSVNDNGLQVFGTITKSAVATGADLVSYGPFNNNNNLRQPYNSDLTFVQNDFSIMFWVYDTGINQHCTLISRDEREFDISRLADAYGNKLRIYTRNFNGDLRAPDSASALPQNRWTCVCVVYTEGKEKRVYINGVLDRLITGTDGEYEIDSPTYGLNIGVRYTGGTRNYSADGIQLALLRIGSGAPSAEQVKKIYDDEKQLFVENAKATLYGSSDVVTALGHDDSSNILHVGTSAGRSEFQGLRRINNTTTAVTTAISASNGLVAEQ